MKVGTLTETIYNRPTNVHLHQGDLPAGLDFGDAVAVDSETQGLNLNRDRLCLLQFSAGDGVCHLVQFTGPPAAAPNICALLGDARVVKIFHYARFDIAMIKNALDVFCTPVYCTKIASRLARTYTDRHGLADVSRELLGLELSKSQQSSDWARPDLSRAQQAYAAADVLNLHAIMRHLNTLLIREGRRALAQDCFNFLPTRAALDLGGWQDLDIFAHK